MSYDEDYGDWPVTEKGLQILAKTLGWPETEALSWEQTGDGFKLQSTSGRMMYFWHHPVLETGPLDSDTCCVAGIKPDMDPASAFRMALSVLAPPPTTTWIPSDGYLPPNALHNVPGFGPNLGYSDSVYALVRRGSKLSLERLCLNYVLKLEYREIFQQCQNRQRAGVPIPEVHRVQMKSIDDKVPYNYAPFRWERDSENIRWDRGERFSQEDVPYWFALPEIPEDAWGKEDPEENLEE